MCLCIPPPVVVVARFCDSLLIHEKMMNDDGTILEAIHNVLRGDTSAYEVIVRAYQDQIYRICASYLKNSDEAEDAVQEVFYRSYRSLSSFSLDRDFRAWIISITFNYLKTRYRVLHRERNLTDRIRRLDPRARQTEEDVADGVERRESEEAVRNAVKVLPHSLREATILYYFEHMSVAEIGEALGVGRENVKSRLHRARKKMRELLSN